MSNTAAKDQNVSFILVIAVFLVVACNLAAQQNRMTVSVDAQGQYVIGVPDDPTLVSGVAASIDGQWVHSSDYPKHEETQFSSPTGSRHSRTKYAAWV